MKIKQRRYRCDITGSKDTGLIAAFLYASSAIEAVDEALARYGIYIKVHVRLDE